jgi:CPW-WPC domain-containing protein
LGVVVGFCALHVDIAAAQAWPNSAGLLNVLRQHFTDEPDVSIHEALKEASKWAAENEDVPLDIDGCDLDLDAACPLGWADAGDGGSCLAPQVYNGRCGDRVQFGGLLPMEKMEQAERCGVHFSCRGQCQEDFNRMCPQGWRFDAANGCVAPSGYDGPCVRRKRFALDAVAEKRTFGTQCAVQWPCRENLQGTLRIPGGFDDECVSDYSVPCPRGWRLEKEHCHAPASYSGLCSMAGAMGHYTHEMKEAWAEVCSARWRCANGQNVSLVGTA